MGTPSIQLLPLPYRVRALWGEFIRRYPWQWFVTLTFVSEIHPEACLKAMRLWLSKLSRSLYGPRWHRKPPRGVYWVAALEYQKRGVLHVHLLIAGVKDARRLTWMDKWEAQGHKNGFSRIWPVESNVAVSKYLSKYVTKGGDIFLSDNLPDVTSGLAGQWGDSTRSESGSALT